MFSQCWFCLLCFLWQKRQCLMIVFSPHPCFLPPAPPPPPPIHSPDYPCFCEKKLLAFLEHFFPKACLSPHPTSRWHKPDTVIAKILFVCFVLNYPIYFMFSLESTIKKEVNQRSKDVKQLQQQRPESPAVTLTWHASKYKGRIKLHQSYIFCVQFRIWALTCEEQIKLKADNSQLLKSP